MWCGNISQNPMCKPCDHAYLSLWTAGTFVTTVPTIDYDSTSTSFTVSSSIHSATQTSSTFAGTPNSTPTVVTDTRIGRSQAMVAIGVGIGLPLSIMLLGGFGFLFWRERRQKPAREVPQGDPPPIPTLQENHASSIQGCHEIDGNIALPELPIQREI